MEIIIGYYSKYKNNLKGDEFAQFSTFYETDSDLIKNWLDNCFKNKVIKNDLLSVQYRNTGNDYYRKKLYNKAMEFYKKSLGFATYNSEYYGLALANKSAVLFMLKDYINCIKVIELCLKSVYPEKLKTKILIRQAECYSLLGKNDIMLKAVLQAKYFMDSDENKTELHCKLLKQIDILQENTTVFDLSNQYKLPSFEDGENNLFAYSSSSVKINYNKLRGKHVVASQFIKQGQLLFLEQAFVFALIFNDKQELINTKCYYCLKHLVSCVPCKSCVSCYYCNEMCCDKSWDDNHKWECVGMQMNIFYELGIAFPALKAIFEGSKSGFRALNEDFYKDVSHFGCKKNNYPYFNSLINNFKNIKNVVPLLVYATAVILYLQNYTKFFEWLSTQKEFIHYELNCLKKYVGGLLVKHMAQLLCNSSIINHWQFNNQLSVPQLLLPVACGMYPSISIMNHSCKPNVSLYFIQDIAVVKAIVDIDKDTEIFNCYGFDYRMTSKVERQEQLKELYHFTCNCSICSDSSKELDILDSFICSKCSLTLNLNYNTKTYDCSTCGSSFPMHIYARKKYEAEKLFQDKSAINLRYIEKSLCLARSILHQYHSFFIDCFDTLFLYSINQGELCDALQYLTKSLTIKKNRYGKTSQIVGKELFSNCVIFINKLKTMQGSETKQNLDLSKIEKLLEESQVILELYYPIHILHLENVKTQFNKIKNY